jgi:hypothetical protein
MVSSWTHGDGLGGRKLRPLPPLADAKADAKPLAITIFSLGGRKRRYINAYRKNNGYVAG